jgi:hypothetical protein
MWRAALASAPACYRWRQQSAAAGDGPAFIPIAVRAAAAERPSTDPSRGTMTIAFGAKLRLTIEGAPDEATLSRVIDALAGYDRRRRCSEIQFGGNFAGPDRALRTSCAGRLGKFQRFKADPRAFASGGTCEAKPNTRFSLVLLPSIGGLAARQSWLSNARPARFDGFRARDANCATILRLAALLTPCTLVVGPKLATCSQVFPGLS